ncbi:hypothetical protein BDV95DRAFT_602958 [Massariosphaeria phaeospora]|uniref:Uncharacterized protein n=1 Tax=Massariosphaeria phaeospora TaxID=100035 RepID=A0A7C8ME85_9PLEO|nr:hypothetical protein BDV95DRAFT_602958 [Massariosphaeria phaeospora]
MVPNAEGVTAEQRRGGDEQEVDRLEVLATKVEELDAGEDVPETQPRSPKRRTLGGAGQSSLQSSHRSHNARVARSSPDANVVRSSAGLSAQLRSGSPYMSGVRPGADLDAQPTQASHSGSGVDLNTGGPYMMSGALPYDGGGTRSGIGLDVNPTRSQGGELRSGADLNAQSRRMSGVRSGVGLSAQSSRKAGARSGADPSVHLRLRNPYLIVRSSQRGDFRSGAGPDAQSNQGGIRSGADLNARSRHGSVHSGAVPDAQANQGSIRSGADLDAQSSQGDVHSGVGLIAQSSQVGDRSGAGLNVLGADDAVALSANASVRDQVPDASMRWSNEAAAGMERVVSNFSYSGQVPQGQGMGSNHVEERHDYHGIWHSHGMFTHLLSLAWQQSRQNGHPFTHGITEP